MDRYNEDALVAAHCREATLRGMVAAKERDIKHYHWLVTGLLLFIVWVTW